MKVALLGNMNNNHFALIRYLRDHGIDADLLLFDNEFDHFNPACDTYSLEFMGYTRRLTWGASTGFLSTGAETVASDVAGYDFLIGCGLSPAFLDKAGLKLDIFIPYGDDIWVETKYRFVAPHRLPSVWSAVHAQRKGIPKAGVFHMGYTNDLYEGQWKRYRGQSERWLDGIPMVYSGEYSPEALDHMAERSHWGQYFKNIRARSDLMVVYHARHSWTGDVSDPGAKGTDKLLRAWAAFRERNPGVRATFVTLEYGRDVAPSKRLIEELGIADSVVWMPKMYRKDLMVGLVLADLVPAEFIHSWVMSGVMYEALVAGKPVLAYRDDSLYTADYPDLYPIMNARESDEILSMFEAYMADPTPFLAMGAQGRAWYEREVAQKAVMRFVDHIRAKG